MYRSGILLPGMYLLIYCRDHIIKPLSNVGLACPLYIAEAEGVLENFRIATQISIHTVWIQSTLHDTYYFSDHRRLVLGQLL